MDFAVKIAQIVTAVGLLAAVVGLRQVQRQRIRAFEDFYVRRYWALMDRLSLAAVKGRFLRLGERDEKAIRAYLALCEDELDLRAEGWISDETWKIWAAGIESQLGEKAFTTVWREVRKEAAKGRGAPMKRLQKFDGDHEDPLRAGPLRRRWRGLHGFL